jgi:methylmalonyl-CoA carboxyltransferase large subunit
MADETKDGLLTELHTLRAELAAITARLAEIEGRAPGGSAHPAPPAGPVAPPAAAAAPPPPQPPITNEVIAAICAAVAAFLGTRAHVRQIRLISSSAWAQQGRVSVQASHTLAR